MGALEFIDGLIGSLAWPVVVVIVVLILRAQLRDLATNLVARFAQLSEMSGLGLSLKFSERLDALEKETEEVTAKTPTGSSRDGENPDGGSETVEGGGLPDGGTASADEEDPLIVLLKAHRVIERSVARALERHGLARQRPMSPRMALKLLSTKVHVDTGLLNLVTELVTLRNQALHEDLRVSREDANRYTWIAADVAEYLDRV